MDGLGRAGFVNGLTLALASAGLGACAVSTPAAITDSQNASGTINNLQFVAEEGVQSGLGKQFKSALANALSAQGVTLGGNAGYLADFTVAERPADLALQDVTGDDANASAPASDFKPRFFHTCKAHRVSASLVIYNKQSGALHSKSEGEYIACPGDTSQLGVLANLLATRALQN
ncbi:hypothetical protein INR77_12810 [Erythrobacter sp. SCSIO 43205]|uniref:hypothetical protein n=1 Tax=Erythrobacter sp. SCSIO 43205 TaxID=2779361 RepID=UPI001CA9C315|nr:hypothetical protein [Erythrobacter sp. SCSIO 43205]UAB77658.1 hypothetical protein INR77_12810 [Erythrobacter sp. SCSIO 43205]